MSTWEVPISSAEVSSGQASSAQAACRAGFFWTGRIWAGCFWRGCFFCWEGHGLQRRPLRGLPLPGHLARAPGRRGHRGNRGDRGYRGHRGYRGDKEHRGLATRQRSKLWSRQLPRPDSPRGTTACAVRAGTRPLLKVRFCPCASTITLNHAELCSRILFGYQHPGIEMKGNTSQGCKSNTGPHLMPSSFRLLPLAPQAARIPSSGAAACGRA